jgi:NitT/TauT family transport system permease protein
MSELIAIRGVRHAYRTKAGPLPVLDGLDLSVAEGGFAAVVGPSGCGKSTLTKLIAGLMKPDEGEVWLHGEPVRGPRATVGMAFQNPVMLEWRTILQNVMLPLEIVPTRLSRSEQQERARYLLALVGLEGFEDKRPSELSGGMRQRASLCRALVHQPEVLILDEPFGALDAFTREDLWQTLHDVKEAEPFTGVLITHDLRESIFLADQVVVLSGRPAHTQYVLDVGLSGPRDLEHLYTPGPPRCCTICATRSRSPRARAGRARGAERGMTDLSAPDAAPVARPVWLKRLTSRAVVAPLAAVVVFLALWEALVRINNWPNYVMASPSDLPAAYARYWQLFLVMGWQTLWRTVVGLVLAVVVGIAIGMVMGFSRTMRDALYPLLVGFNAIPKATVVPIVALLFVGMHDFNTVLIAFMISFFPIAVSVSIGLSTLEPEYRDILRSLGASRTAIFWKIALPKTLPEFFGALKVAVTLAFIGTNLMEIVSPHGRGLGALFDSAKTNSDYPLMFAVLIALAALGILLYYVVVALEKTFAGWAERDHH